MIVIIADVLKRSLSTLQSFWLLWKAGYKWTGTGEHETVIVPSDLGLEVVNLV